MNNLELLIGLISIALGLFLGLLFGLAGFRKGVTSELSTIKDAVVATRTTVEKIWDLVSLRFVSGSGTVTRELENLGTVKISAELGRDKTGYLIEIEKPILKEGLLEKKFREPEFVKFEKELLGNEGTFSVFPPNRLRYTLPSTDAKACTEFISFLLKELNSTYVESLKGIKKFEEHILT